MATPAPPPPRPCITLVLARARNGAIGQNGALPWRLPADLRRFKHLTAGAPMVMGRRTFDSLPGLLPGRRHIVLTRDASWAAPGAEAVATPEDAIAAAGDVAHLSVIGGAEIYRLFEPVADAIELTHIDAAPHADTFMPLPDPAWWVEVSRVGHPAADGHPAHAFVRYERRR